MDVQAEVDSEKTLDEHIKENALPMIAGIVGYQLLEPALRSTFGHCRYGGCGYPCAPCAPYAAPVPYAPCA